MRSGTGVGDGDADTITVRTVPVVLVVVVLDAALVTNVFSPVSPVLFAASVLWTE